MKNRDPRAVATYRIEFERSGRRIAATTEDVSTTGLFIRTPEPARVGEIIELFIYLDEVLPVRVTARVVHVLSATAARALSRVPGFGCALVEQAGGRLEALKRHLAHHLEDATAARDTHSPSDSEAVIADPSDRLVERLAAVLTERGFRVRTAANGVEAFSACLSKAPHVLLAADHMPLMDGWTLLGKLKAHGALATLPVVLMTEQPSEVARLTAYRMGARDFIHKPFTDEEIALRLASAAAHARRTAESVILRGKIAEVGLGSLLSLLDYERKSGLLLLTSRGNVATLFIDRGRVVKVDPTPEHLTPAQCLLGLLDWKDGRFEFIVSEAGGGHDEIGLPTMQILLEHARRVDEANRTE